MAHLLKNQTGIAITLVVLMMLAACAATPSRTAGSVADVERAFAQTMALRDHAAFRSFLSDDAVFISGDTPLRGREAVADHWARFFTEPIAPFSWAPETVEVLDSGDLALSTGPVWNAQGERIATFTSIWRLDADGWRIVFDRGTGYCQ